MNKASVWPIFLKYKSGKQQPDAWEETHTQKKKKKGCDSSMLKCILFIII